MIKNLNGVVLRKAHGNETDPIGMIENLIASMDVLGFDSDYGDLAFCFVDLDCDKGKEQQIRKALELATSNNIHLIISNPCFLFMSDFNDLMIKNMHTSYIFIYMVMT